MICKVSLCSTSLATLCLFDGSHPNRREVTSYCGFDMHFPDDLEKAMAPHSSTLAWKIPWTEELVGCRLWGCMESDTTERLHFHFHALEKEMATHSSVLAWRIPGTGEPGGLLSMGSD